MYVLGSVALSICHVTDAGLAYAVGVQAVPFNVAVVLVRNATSKPVACGLVRNIVRSITKAVRVATPVTSSVIVFTVLPSSVVNKIAGTKGDTL